MPYHDTFYTAENIIGYTGQLHQLPTVYFRCDRRNLVGRITQTHPYPQNVGRARPATSIGYRMGNEMTPNGLRLVERHATGAPHTSRNVFVALDGGDPGQRHGANMADLARQMQVLAILAQSIRNCPQPKQIHQFSRADQTRIARARQAKGNALNEMMWNARVMGGLKPSEVAHNARLLPDFRADPRLFAASDAASRRRGH